MPMLYFVESNWKPIDDNPFSKDNGYGKLWSAFIYDETLNNSYTNFYPNAKVYSLSVNPLIDRHFERLIDFINYETKYGRNIILKVPSSTKSVIENMINTKSIQDNKLIRLNDERWLVHSTTKQAWSEIQETGSLLSPTYLLNNRKTINEIGLKALLEPSDYSDYVMLDVLNGCGEIVVNSRQLGYICFDPNINYVPGIRLYFDAHKIIRDGLATRDGLHVLKVFEKLPLDKYLVMAIDEAILPQQSWTPTKFTQIANEHFLKLMSSSTGK